MADQPAAPAKRKGFNASNPGAKEYLIVGGVALLVGLAYLWWKNKQSGSSSGTTTGTQNPAGAVDANGNPVPGIQINQGTGTDAGGLQNQMQDQQSSPVTTAGGGSSGGVGGAGGAGGVGGGAGAGAAGAGVVPVPASQQNLAAMNAAPLAVAAKAPAPALARQATPAQAVQQQQLGAGAVGKPPASSPGVSVNNMIRLGQGSQPAAPKPAPAPAVKATGVSVNNLKRLGG